MNPIFAYLTEQTCGESCWAAREDICRCSCNGKNHGCLRDSSGTRPVRSSRIDGYHYELQAVGYDVSDIAQKINEAAGITYIYAYSSRDSMFRSIPAKIRTASQSQIARWPELAAYRNLERHEYSPYLLWVKVQ